MKLKITEKYTTLTSSKSIINNKDIISLVIKKKSKTKIFHS